MPLNNARGGLGYAAEFQSSALPWVTASVATTSSVGFSFHKITRFLQITNLSDTASVKLGFTQNGVDGTNYMVFPPAAQSNPVEIRTKHVWVSTLSGSASFTLLAGLTNIEDSMMPELTGTFFNGDPGWEGVG